jgi:hypothetical protein
MPINFNLGSADNGATLDIQDATDSDVIAALNADTAFPSRDLTLGRISASFSTPTATFTPVAGSTVSMSASATFNSGMAVFSKADPVIQALPLDPSVSLNFGLGANDRLMMVSFGYTAKGSINGTVPIGVLGSATFGVSGQSDAAFALVHRFDAGAGARTVMTEVADSFRLPTQVRAAGDLKPGTWLIAEVDGTAALNVAASLGYKLDYTKQLTVLGISHDLGVKIDAAITATFGFTTSGKFLLALSRPSANVADQTLRVQLMKQRKEGLSVGLGLTAGITADPQLPATIDDFLSAVFGTQGQQILKDLHSIENWTTGDLGTNAAALITNTAKDLLRKIGLDPDNALAQATGALKDALASWDQLAQNGSAEVQSLVWGLLGNPGAATRTTVVNMLTGLANGSTFDKTLSDALQDFTQRQWLTGIADTVGSLSGLALADKKSEVQQYANDVLSVLNGSVFDKLKTAIEQEFDLGKIRQATDPAALSQWVQARLAAFLDKTSLIKSDLAQIQKALQTLGSKISDLYSKTKSAINSRYSIDFAAKYSSNTSDTALIDVEFDMANAQAAALFLNVIGTGAGPAFGPNALFALNGPVPRVTIHEALLTHEIHTSATTHFAIPFLTADTAHLNDTVATLAIEQNGGHLVASVKSKDQVKTGRFASILSLAESLTIIDGVVQPAPTGAIAYEMRLIRKTMTQSELVFGTRDFVATYLGNTFPSLASYTDQFLKSFDITVSDVVPNAINNFADMAVSMQVALGADILAGWLVARTGADLLAAQAATSRLIQTFLRKSTALSYLQDLDNLSSPTTVAPLLVWCALPVVAGVDFDRSNLTITALDTGKDTYWNNPDVDLVKAMVNLLVTEKRIESLLQPLHDRLVAAGRPGDAQFYGPDFPSAASSMKSTVLFTGPQGGLVPTFTSLLFAEHNVIGDPKQGIFPASGAAKALEAAAALVASASSGGDARAEIDKELATFANALTSTLNSGLSNIYMEQNLMLYGPMLLTEISRSLATENVTPRAMLQLLSLRAGHKFDLSKFLTGDYPDQNEVAVGQTLVSGV